MSGAEGKPFAIPKQLLWQARKSVKANGGAPGADGVTVEAFGKDLMNNLYKVWNRMSSGTYFPPPVRAVEIPRAPGGTRILGVPAVRRQGGADSGRDGAGARDGGHLPR